jgi:hypothetical protein
MKDKTGLPKFNNGQGRNDYERRSIHIPAGFIDSSMISDINAFLDNTAGGTDANTTKAPTTNVLYDHGVATTGVHGAGTSTIATVGNIATHTALTTGVHGLGTMAGASSADYLKIVDIATASTSRTFHVNNFNYPDPVSEWEPTVNGAYLGASLSAKKCWLPLNFLQVGDIITTYALVGDAIETNALTLDCKLVQVNKANPLTTTDVANGAIVQVTADGNFDVAVNPDDTTVTTDKQYTLELLGTTAVADEIYVMGAELTVTRLI